MALYFNQNASTAVMEIFIDTQAEALAFTEIIWAW